MGSRFMASRMRCSMNQADLKVSPYLRSISRAETPFLEDAISKITKTRVRTVLPALRLGPQAVFPQTGQRGIAQDAHRLIV